MTLLIDTSVLIDLENNVPHIKQRLQELSKSHPNPACISSITYVEFLTGIENHPEEKKAEAIAFIWRFPVLQTTNETAMWLSHLKCKYRKEKSLSNLFIASHALEHRLTLVTTDKDFENIAEIKKIVF